jgi:hypothetical protein
VKVGDLVQTKKNGFGVGPRTHIGIITDIRLSNAGEGRGSSTKIITICAPKFLREQWYDWQLEMVNASR